MGHLVDGKDCMVSIWIKQRAHLRCSDGRNISLTTGQISEWILLIAAYVFVAARIYTRLFRMRERLNWADWLLIASAFDALGLIICDTLTYQMGVLDEYETSVKLSKVSNIFSYCEDALPGNLSALVEDPCPVY